MRQRLLVPALLGALTLGCPGPDAERTGSPTKGETPAAETTPAEDAETPDGEAADPAGGAEPTAAAELPTLRYYELPG